jgi:acyl-CoA synthetase (AMP-forming)/AMP-acid ligase II
LTQIHPLQKEKPDPSVTWIEKFRSARNISKNLVKVLEAAVIGVKDKIFGEQVKAILVLKPGEKGTEEEIKQFCAQHIAGYKVPKYVEFLNEPLPRNPGERLSKPN